jgi:hypothetical protein
VTLQHLGGGSARLSDLQDVGVVVVAEHRLLAHAASELQWVFHFGDSLAGYERNRDFSPIDKTAARPHGSPLLQ